MDYIRSYLVSPYSDYDYTIEGNALFLSCWGEDSEGEEFETTFKLNIDKLVEYMDDEDALGNYIESGEEYTDYEARGDEFYRRAEKELEKHFGCTNAYLEPSTQLGQGSTFLFSDDMSFEGNFDYQTGEDYIREDNFDGFLQLCFDSFRPVTNESLTDLAGTKKCKDKATMILSELEAENFTEDQVLTVCRMIKDLIEQRHSEPAKTPRQKLKDTFDLDV